MSDFRPIEMFNPTSGPETHMINMDHVSAIFPDSRGKAILLTSMGETIKTHEDYNSMHTVTTRRILAVFKTCLER
jgi:hypothetical protein